MPRKAPQPSSYTSPAYTPPDRQCAEHFDSLIALATARAVLLAYSTADSTHCAVNSYTAAEPPTATDAIKLDVLRARADWARRRAVATEQGRLAVGVDLPASDVRYLTQRILEQDDVDPTVKGLVGLVQDLSWTAQRFHGGDPMSLNAAGLSALNMLAHTEQAAQNNVLPLRPDEPYPAEDAGIAV